MYYVYVYGGSQSSTVFMVHHLHRYVDIYKDIYWLVVFNHLELNLENMKVNGWRIIPYIYILWKMKNV